ncbi:MAG: PD40 domain-containing protein, partial [Chloroflexi bacterium]|nr:PD40 domain-containing protein [Chloroflexota bacterium]
MPTTHRPALDLERLARVPFVASFDVSSKGDIAFASNASGCWEIYVMSPDGGAPRQVTGGPGSKLFPRWSRDGRRLAYAQDFQGDERYDIFAFEPAAGGDAVNLTPDTPDSIQPHVSWSPDGRRIAVVSNRSGRFQTCVVEADGSGTSRLLHDHALSDEAAEWSPDGRWIAVSTMAAGQEVRTYLAPADDPLAVA